GAVLQYHLKQKPRGDLTLDVFDPNGVLVRTLSSKEEPEETDPLDEEKDDEAKKDRLTTHVGVNRVVWDLTYKGATTIKKAKHDMGQPKEGPLVPPGTYTLKLTVEGQALEQRVEVRQDPRVTVPAPEIDEQGKLALAVRADITRLTGLVEGMRSVRKQLADRNELLKDNAEAEPLVKAANGLIARLDDVEAKLHNPKAQVGYDILAMRGGAKLYSELIWLFE